MYYIGAHISISNGLLNSAKIIKSYGGNILQIFSSNPKKKKLIETSNDEIIKFKKYTKKNDIKVVIHAPYVINIANDWDEYSWFVLRFIHEIEYAHKIGAYCVVIHLGKQLKLTKSDAYNNMYSLILYVLTKTKKYNDVIILLETPSGQGTEMCYKIEDLAYFYNKFIRSSNKNIRDRVKICIDTCHIFSSGYNLRTKKDVKLYLDTFNEMIGLKYIGLVHINDCIHGLGARIDRHESLGKGNIGIIGLLAFFKKIKKISIPVILETPGYNYKKEITILKNA